MRRPLVPAGLLAALLGAGALVGGEPAPHPLDPLGAAELQTAVRLLGRAGRLAEDALFPYLGLDEPDKEAVLAWSPGDPLPRSAKAVVLQGGETFEAVVDLAAGRVAEWRPRPGVEPPILPTAEWSAAQEIARAHPGWRQALAARDLDPETVVPVPLTAAVPGEGAAAGDRRVQVVGFDGRGVANYWGRPVEGLVATVSLAESRVVELVDTGPVPMPRGPVDFAPGVAGEAREIASPVAIAQPGGPGFELAGHRVDWQGWSFRWRIDPRVGPVVSLVRYLGRSVLYQGSLSEMFVPYTDPGAGWYFRAYLDAGEYGIGKLVSPLEPGADCPDPAVYLHPWLADDWGTPFRRPRAACLFERPTGDVAWRHFESLTGEGEARAATELVFRTVPAVGNYDYVLDWIFRQDGSIRIAVGASGVPQVKAVAPPDRRHDGAAEAAAYGTYLAPHTVGVHHDHVFSFRLDLDVDGPVNSLQIDRLRTAEVEGGGPRPSTWVVEPSIAAREREARLRIDLERPALWRVVHPRVTGPLGDPVSYQLVPGANTLPLFADGDPLRARARFADHHLWVTPFRPDELYAAGDYPHLAPGGDGLGAWTDRDRPIAATDLVVWYTLGMRHVVRPEDWPVLPTRWSGFELRPFGFFAANPALDLPGGER